MKNCFSFPVDRFTYEVQIIKSEKVREEEAQCQKMSETGEDFDEDDDADTIEEEPDFSTGSNKELFSESAEETRTEDEETEMKNRRYAQIFKPGDK